MRKKKKVMVTTYGSPPFCRKHDHMATCCEVLPSGIMVCYERKLKKVV